MQGRDTPVPAQPRVIKRAPLRHHRATVAVRGWAARSPVALLRLARRTRGPHGVGRGWGAEAAAGALGKQPYRRITGTAEDTAFAANGSDGDTGRRTRRGDTSAGDSDSAWLPAPGKRKKRGAWRGANTDTDTTSRPLLCQPPPLPIAAVPTAATWREATGGGPDRSRNMRPGRARNRPTVRRKRKAHTCGGGCTFWKGRLAVSGRRWNDWPRSARRGQPRALTARARDKRGDHLWEGDEGKRPRRPNGNDYGSATPPPPRRWSASRRSRCHDELGGSTNSREADRPRPSGPGPRDPLEDLKILLLRKLEE